MITLTEEQAQQIEEALDTAYGLAESGWAEHKYATALATIRAARAQEQAEQEPMARVTGYYSGLCVIEPLNRATVLPTDMALYAAPVQQVTRADLKAAFKEGFERAADREKNKWN